MSVVEEFGVEVKTARPDLRSRAVELELTREAAQAGPSNKVTEAQHAKGKLTVRERLDLLFDKNTFREIEGFRRHRATGFGLEDKKPHGDGVVTGWGLVNGRTVFVYAHDFRVFGGSLGEAHTEKIHKVMDLAESADAPIVSLSDGAGARIQEGVTALAGYGGIFRRNVRCSGVIPQISVMLGPCAGGATYSPTLTDFVFMVRGSAQMYITGPDVVRGVTGEEITHEQLGGAEVHAGVSGAAGFMYDSEEERLEEVRRLLSLLPQNNRELPPSVQSDDPAYRRSESLLDTVPANPNQSYDMRAVIEEIIDDGDLFEVHASWAINIICGLARLDGHVVGIVANQPASYAGVLDIHASEKAARFVSLCDSFQPSR